MNVKRISPPSSAVYIGDGELLLKAVFVLLGFGAGLLVCLHPPPSFPHRFSLAEQKGISVGSRFPPPRSAPRSDAAGLLTSPSRFGLKPQFFRKGKQLIAINKKRPSWEWRLGAEGQRSRVKKKTKWEKKQQQQQRTERAAPRAAGGWMGGTK